MSEHEVVLKFHSPAHARKLLKALHSGKGMVVRPEMVHGAGFLSGLSNIGKKLVENPAVREIGKKALDKGIEMGAKYAEKKLTGGGLWGSVGDIADHILGDGVKHHKGRGRPRKEEGDGLWGSIGDVADHILGDGVKHKKRQVKIPKSLRLYRGGSFSPLN